MGAVHVLFLRSDGTARESVKIADRTGGGPDLNGPDRFGSALSAPGDLDGDGLPDLVVGAPLDNVGGFGRGSVHVLFLRADGQAKGSVRIASGTGGGPPLANSDSFGSALASPGDLNGDGVPDLAVSAPGDATGRPDRGTVHLLFLTATPVERPGVRLEQAAGQDDPTRAGPLLFTAVFSEPVTGFDGSDVLFDGSTVGGSLTATLTPSGPQDGTTYTVSVTGMTGSGIVRVRIPADAAHDLAGNGNLPSASTDNTITLEADAPTLTLEQATGQVDPTSADTLFFVAVFSEPVTGFDASDVSFAGSTAGGPLTARVLQGGARNGTTYTLSVTGMSGPGTVVASIPAGAAVDAAGNPNRASTSTDNSFTFLGDVPDPPFSGTIVGTLFVDGNANKERDPGEGVVRGQSVFLDDNGNGVVDPGEPTTRTDGQGNFTFGNLGFYYLTVTVRVNLSRASFARTVSGGFLGNSANVDLGVQTVTPALNPTFPNKNLFSFRGGNRGYIAVLYRSILGHEPDAAGLNFWLTELPAVANDPVAHQMARLDVARIIWESQEHRELQIHRYYRDLLGRPPEVLGGNYWFGQLFGGIMSEEEVVAGFLSSDEYRNQFAGDEAFVRGLGDDVLGIPPGTGSLPVTYNAGAFDPLARLQDGTRTRRETALDVLFSDQAILRGADGSYQAYLFRNGVPSSEQTFWLNLARNGGLVREVAIGVLGSEILWGELND